MSIHVAEAPLSSTVSTPAARGLRLTRLFQVILLLVARQLTLAANPTATEAAEDPNRFEPAIQAYERSLESGNLPKPGTAIVFLGSSTFTQWKRLQEDFPGLPVINRGFGGSQFTHLLRYADRLITPLMPAQVVIYCGGNDLAKGHAPSEVASNAAALLDLLSRRVPDVRILVLGSKIAPKRAHLAESIRTLNSALEALCAQRPNASFIDMSPLVLGEDGVPDEKWFLDDRLHLNSEGYEQLRKWLISFLEPKVACTPAASLSP